MRVDETRWRILLAAARDSEDSIPPYLRVQEAQRALAQARVDLDRHRAAEQLGKPDTRHQPEKIAAQFARDIAHLERRVDEADREAKRLDGLHREASARRVALSRLVEAVRTWARQQGITLPGDEPALAMPGFAASPGGAYSAPPAPSAAHIGSLGAQRS
jgi:hypothetical protein